MTVVTLKYRSPRPLDGLAKHTTAWQDLQGQPYRSQSGRKRKFRSINIGIMGSSAADISPYDCNQLEKPSLSTNNKLDKIIMFNRRWLSIITYVLTDGVNGGNKNGGNQMMCELFLNFHSIGKLPHAFIGDKDVHSPMGCEMGTIEEMGIQSDLHTLARRGHCFQRRAAPGTGSYTWMNRIWEFMNHKKINR